QDDGDRSRGRGVVGQARGPVRRHQLATVDQDVDVIGLVHGDDVGLQAFDHGVGLLGRAAVRLVHREVFTGGLLPVRREDLVVVLVALAGDVVADVEQGGGGRGGRGQGTHAQHAGEQGAGDGFQ